MNNKKLTLTAALIVGLLFLTNCGVKETASPPPPALQSIAISPLSPSMAPGTTTQLRAIGKYSGGSQTDLTTKATWTSSNTAVATIDTHGLVSALSMTGTTTISASYGGISGSTDLTSSDLASIAITPEDQTIASGTTIQYSAKGTLANTATQIISSFVTWTASPAGTASISNSGLATAGTTTGTATIFAELNGITGTTSLTSADVASIAVAPPDKSIALGTTQQYTATGTLAATGSPTQDLTSRATWTSSLPSVATISNTGLAISQNTGTTFITATYLVSSNTATLVVKPAALLSIAVTPISATVALGQTQQFTATGTFSDNSTQNITSSVSWSSSNSLVSTISNTAGSNGLATTVGVGTATITATSGSISASTTLTVTAAQLVSITVLPPNPVVSLLTTNTEQFQAIGLFTNNNVSDLTASVSWSSSNISVATINTPGAPGLASLVSSGTTTITATSGSISGSTLLTVTF